MFRCGICGGTEQAENGKCFNGCGIASSGNSELLLRDHIAQVTKAILFEDCGSTEDWEENTDLGKAAIRAYRPAVQAWRNDALESAAKICERYGQADAARDIRALIAQ